MTEQTLTTEAAGAYASDPLKTAADAMSLAVQAARDGAADAQQRVSEMIPAIGGFLTRLTYSTCYAVSYGVVFPTLFVVQAVPKNNVLVHGLIDGALAARDSVSVRGEVDPPDDSASRDVPVSPDGDPVP